MSSTPSKPIEPGQPATREGAHVGLVQLTKGLCQTTNGSDGETITIIVAAIKYHIKANGIDNYSFTDIRNRVTPFLAATVSLAKDADALAKQKQAEKIAAGEDEEEGEDDVFADSDYSNGAPMKKLHKTPAHHQPSAFAGTPTTDSKRFAGAALRLASGEKPLPSFTAKLDQSSQKRKADNDDNEEENDEEGANAYSRTPSKTARTSTKASGARGGRDQRRAR